MLLDDSMNLGPRPGDVDGVPSLKSWSVYEPIDMPIPDLTACDNLILPRGDRRRLAGLPVNVYSDDEEEDTGSSDKENEFDASCAPAPNSDYDRPTKRVRFQDPDELASQYPVEDVNTALLPDLPMDFTPDDSGVFLMNDPLVPSEEERNSFVQLAFDAEGFDGPIGDGNVFPDMHPMYYDDYAFDISPALDPYAPSRPGDAMSSPSPLDIRVHGWATPPHTEHITPIEQELQSQTHSQEMHCIQSVLHEDDVAPPSQDEGIPADETTPAGHLGLERSTTDGPVAPVFSARQSLAQFLAFHGKGSLVCAETPPALASDPLPGTSSKEPQTAAPALRDTPAELLDERTLVLAEDYEPPSTVHRYMASMDLIQKRALVRTLSSYCAVDCAVREYLGHASAPSPEEEDAHLLLDCDTAVLFFPQIGRAHV